MALTYQELFALRGDADFRGRTSVACVKFAEYITGEASNTPAHSTRYKWAQTTLVQPEVAVNQVIATVTNDPAVVEQGATITDAALQSVVENSVNKLL